jgi:hypothetical protein
MTSIWLETIVGPARAVLKSRASPKKLRALRAQLLLLNNAFLQALPWRRNETPAAPPLNYPIRTCG